MPPFANAELSNHGSLFATRPIIGAYVATRKELLEGADTVLRGGPPINRTYALKDASQAHTDLEGRATTGASILKP